MTNKNGLGAVLSSFAYTYSADGNILSETDHNGAFTNYTYDKLGRLISEVGNSGSRYYAYDIAGNRTQAIIDTITTVSYTYNTDGSLAYEILNNGTTSETTTYSYDLNGNLITKSNGVNTTNYTYDVWGKMTSGAGATYTYSSQGLRTSKTVNGSTDYFVLVSGNVWSDGDADYFRGIELISNGSQLYLYNIRGDVIQLVDYSGTVTKTYDYDAYGNELTRDLADENPFRYCGEYYDTETGFIYLRARYYDPLTGRFAAMDTHWNPSNAIYGDNPVKTSRAEDCKSLYPNVNAIKQSTNLYVYCLNNPNSFTDKSGYSATKALEIWSVLGAWLMALDGVLPIGDLVYLIGLVTLGAVAYKAGEEIGEKVLARDHSVYVLKDTSGTVQYVGRTKNVEQREYAHKQNFYRKNWKFEVIASGLTLKEARALEQACMAFYHTIKTENKGNNQINGISPKHWNTYREVAKGVSDYIWNQVSNEIAYWLENS